MTRPRLLFTREVTREAHLLWCELQRCILDKDVAAIVLALTLLLVDVSRASQLSKRELLAILASACDGKVEID